MRRINARLSEISSETRSQTSRKSKTSSKRSVRTTKSIRIEAAAKAAELETELKYLKPLQEQEAALKAREADIKRLKLEKELHVAKARLQAVSETDSTEDYDSMLDNLPTDTDRVQQYRRDNAMSPSPFVPTTTTTNEQGTNVAPAGMTTTASITTPMHFTATAHVPTMMPSIPIAAVRTSSPAANVMQLAGTSTQGGMTTRDNVGIQPLVPPTIGTPPAVSVPLPASHEFISTLNPDAQRFVPQCIAQDTT